MNTTKYGYPIEALQVAQAQAAEVRERKAQAPCTCKECVKALNLESVQRILAKWTPMDRIAS